MGRLARTDLWTIASCMLLESLCGSLAHGGPILRFTDHAAFFSAVQVASTETFDEFPSGIDIGVGSVTLDGITYTSFNPSAIWHVTRLFVTPSPPNSLVVRNPPAAPITLTFEGGGFTDAMGFFLVGIGGIPPAFFRVEVFALNGERLDEMIDPGGTTRSVFRGYAGGEGILSIQISPVQMNGNISNFHLDSVSRGAIRIAEPSTLSMVGAVVLVGLGYGSRRRRLQVTPA